MLLTDKFNPDPTSNILSSTTAAKYEDVYPDASANPNLLVPVVGEHR